jgi:pyruvate formate lyase activating enzyme
MTLTGGEPTMQPDMAEALLRLAKAEYIATAIETCGHTRWAVWERLLPYLDDILFDLKHTDPDLHRTFTGLDNGLILSNLRQLAALDAPVTVRVPLIPDFNATPEYMRTMAGFVRSLDGPVKGIDLLPYHSLAQVKYKALGRDYPWAGHDRLAEAEVERLAEIVAGYGFKVGIGG